MSHNEREELQAVLKTRRGARLAVLEGVDAAVGLGMGQIAARSSLRQSLPSRYDTLVSLSSPRPIAYLQRNTKGHTLEASNLSCHLL